MSFSPESWFLWDDTTNQDSDEDVTLGGTFLQSTHSFANRRKFSAYRRLSSRTTQTSEDGKEADDGDGGGGGGGNGALDTADTVPVPSPRKSGASVNAETPDNVREENGAEVSGSCHWMHFVSLQ